MSHYFSKEHGKGKKTPFRLLSNTNSARAEPSHLLCYADNTLHLTPVLKTLKHENSPRIQLLQPHSSFLPESPAGPLVFSAEPQNTSQACLLARSHKPGHSRAPSDATPSLSEHGSAQERQARIPAEQPPVEDKSQPERWASSDQELRR